MRSDSRLHNYLPSPLCTVVFIVSFIAFLVAGNPVLQNPDVPWHLAAGDLIRASGIPAFNTWSYAEPNTPWYNAAWLWDCIISFLAAHMGLMGVYIFTAAFSAFILSFVAYAAKYREMASDFYIVLAVLLLWYVLLSSFFAEPWMVTFSLCAVFQHLLHRSRTSPRVLWFLPMLMVIWANMHGGFIAGYTLIAAYIIEAHVTGQYAWRQRLLLCFIVTGFACFINPYHVHIITGVLRCMHSVMRPYLADWQPIFIGSDMAFMIFLLFFICCSNFREEKIPLADKIITLFWLFSAIFIRRNFPIFAVLAVPYLAYNLQTFARYTQGAAYKNVILIATDTASNRLRIFSYAILIAAVIFLTPVKSLLIAPGKVSDDLYGMKEVVQALNEKAPGAHFINDYNLGGRLIYASKGTWPVFVDGRAGSAYSEKLLADTIKLLGPLPGYKSVFDAYSAKGVILLRSSRLAEFIALSPQPEWKEIFSNADIVAYLRTGAR